MKKQQRNRLIVAAVLTVLCALLALVPFTGLEAQGKGVLIVFVWAILMWIVRPIPEYLIGVLAAAVLAIFFGMKTNVVSGFPAPAGGCACGPASSVLPSSFPASVNVLPTGSS